MATTTTTSAPKPQPGRNVVVTLAVELIGVLLLMFLAGVSDDMGSVAVIFMWGIMLGWLLLNVDQLSKWIGKA